MRFVGICVIIPPGICGSVRVRVADSHRRRPVMSRPSVIQTALAIQWLRLWNRLRGCRPVSAVERKRDRWNGGDTMLPKSGSLMSNSLGHAGGDGGFQEGMLGLSCGQLREAFEIFQGIVKISPTPAAHFNLALCYVQAELWHEAIADLEWAVQLLPQHAAIRPELDLSGAVQAMERREAETEGYRGPMTESLPARMPSKAKERMLRLLVDLYLATGQADSVRQTAQQLQSKRFDNVERALQAVNQQ